MRLLYARWSVRRRVRSLCLSRAGRSLRSELARNWHKLVEIRLFVSVLALINSIDSLMV